MHNESSSSMQAQSATSARSLPFVGAAYEVYRHLGSGQMSDVFLGEHLASGTPVAVKVLRTELSADGVSRARFEREVEAVSRLESPHTVRFYDVGETDAGQLYIVMELLAGEELRERMERVGQFSAAEVLHIVSQIAASLGDAHSAGVVHRDLKPENIQFCGSGSGALKVLDFGLAKLHDSNVQGKLTGKMRTVGTPAYIAPEVATAGRKADWRGDLYSLAVLTFELLAGVRPFDGTNPMSVMLAHLHDPIPEVRVHRPDLPRSMNVFFRAALAKDPQARISSAELFVKALANALQPH